MLRDVGAPLSTLHPAPLEKETMSASVRTPHIDTTTPLRLGDWVIALRRIVETERGLPEGLRVGAPDVLVAELAAPGQVVHLGRNGLVTVMFESGATDCVPDVEVVRWSAHDVTVSRRAGRA